MTTGPTNTAPSDARVSVRVGRSARAEALVFERRRADGVDALTIVIDRLQTGIVGCYGAPGLAPEAADALREAATDDQRASALGLEAARRRVARAVWMSRASGRPVPRWLSSRAWALGDLDDALAATCDVYACDACERPLAPELQVALARGGCALHAAPRCVACGGHPVAPASPDGVPMSLWRARAWVRVAAGDPRRALVFLGYAEAGADRAPDVDVARGAAMLALSNPVQATHHLRRGLSRAPEHLRGRALLVEALARCGMAGVARREMDALVARAPHLRRHAERVLRVLGEDAHRETQVEARCLRALRMLDLGHGAEAQALLSDGAASASPVGQRALEALASGHDPRAIPAEVLAPRRRGLNTALGRLGRAV